MTNTVTVKLPKSIIKRLEHITSTSRLTTQKIIKQAISDRLDYEEYVFEQIDAGLADIEAGRVVSHAEMMNHFGSQNKEHSASWNYRIIKHTEPITGEVGYSIHEAYYNSKNEISAITERTVAPFGETPEELIRNLENMLKDAKAQAVVDGDNLTFASMDD